MVARSPLDIGGANISEARFLRGNLTHALLQFLPDLPADQRLDAAKRYLAQPGHGISQRLQASIANETVAVLNHPDFHQLFGAGSRPEVPLAGLLGDQALSGQIDRLFITDDKIWIVDYKTNRPSPDNPADVPIVYKAQLQSYYDALKAIFPQKDVRCFLLWTDQCNFMEINCQ
tara:strand:- start:506 stop:1027 length:522 start_codon:yes stop_codon:yes gene_type:complete